MDISKTGSVNTPRKAAKTNKAKSGGNFSSHLSEGASHASDAPEFQDVSSVASVNNILALQEVPDATSEESRRALYRRGHDILDRLSEIQRDILSGSLSKERLQNLAHMLRQRRETVEDEKLQAIIDEIELRAEVEIAKWASRK